MENTYQVAVKYMILLSLIDLNFSTAGSSDKLYTDDMHLVDGLLKTRLLESNAARRIDEVTKDIFKG